MKRPREMKSLSSFLNTYAQPKTEPKAAVKVAPVIGEKSAVVLTQTILYRTHGNAVTLIRPGYKRIPKGAIGTVTAVADEGKTFHIALRQPVLGTLAVSAQEIKALE